MDASPPETAVNKRTYDSGVAFFAAGVGNRDSVLTLETPLQSQCDAALDFISQNQKFLVDLESRGFRNVACVREDGGKYVRETRVISRKSPVKPAPRAAPLKYDARTSEARA
jgi:hypothetical protein